MSLPWFATSEVKNAVAAASSVKCPGRKIGWSWGPGCTASQAGALRWRTSAHQSKGAVPLSSLASRHFRRDSVIWPLYFSTAAPPSACSRSSPAPFLSSSLADRLFKIGLRWFVVVFLEGHLLRGCSCGTFVGWSRCVALSGLRWRCCSWLCGRLSWVRVRCVGSCSMFLCDVHAHRSVTLHYTPVHSTTLNHTTPHYITLHYAPLHYTTLHHTILHYTPLHYTILQYLPLHFTTLHYTTLHYTTATTTTTTTQLHSTTLNYTTLHYITFRHTPLHHTTLHYITLNDTAPQIDR